MNTIATKLGVNTAALAIAAAATVIPVTVAAAPSVAAPVSSIASQWNTGVENLISDVPLAPLCTGTLEQCLAVTDGSVLFSLNLYDTLKNIPLIGPFLAGVLAILPIPNGCFFGFCLQTRPVPYPAP
jgi:hypothetical protein